MACERRWDDVDRVTDLRLRRAALEHVAAHRELLEIVLDSGYRSAAGPYAQRKVRATISVPTPPSWRAQ